MERPNILWIITDQQSANMLGCAGNNYVSTPNMDLVARDGVRFGNAYCANPVCLPSRFAMMTGLYPSAAGIRGDNWREEYYGLPAYATGVGLGTLLKQNGYDAVYGGKVNLPDMSAESLGFDYICADERDLLAETFADYIRKRDGNKPFAAVASFIDPHDICLMAVSDFADRDTEAKYLTGLLADEVENVRAAAALPAGMDEKTFFEKVCPPLPDNHLPASDEPGAIAILQEQRPFKKFTRQYYSDEKWRLHRYAYCRLVESVDAQIGVLFDALIKSGLWDETVVILTSDHGDMDGSHKMEHKENLYQECCRVPLIVKGVSGKMKDRVFYGAVTNGPDLTCTILDYAGVGAPGYFEGESLKPIVEEGAEVRGRIVVVECHLGIMATDGRYKYVSYEAGENGEQFYDLKTNPGEMYNELRNAPPEILERMKNAVRGHAARRKNNIC